MDPDDPEWLIWARITKVKIESIMKEVSTLKDQITSLQTSNAEFADSNKQLQSDNLDLSERFLCLEHGTVQQDQITALQTSHAELADSNKQFQSDNLALKKQISALYDQISPLRTSNAELKQLQSDNLAFSDRVLDLEQEMNQQDQLNARKSQDVQNCEGQIDRMLREYTSLLKAVKCMQDNWLKEASIQPEELEELKTQVRALTIGDKRGSLPYGDLGSQDLTRPILTPSRSFRGMSQATTEDEDMHTDLLRTQTQAIENTQMVDNFMLATQSTRSTPRTTIAPQGPTPILELLKYGDNRVPQSVMQYEAEMVSAIVKVVNNGHVRDTILDTLNRKGWTWENARKELSYHGRHEQEGNHRRQIRQYGRNQSGYLF